LTALFCQITRQRFRRGCFVFSRSSSSSFITLCWFFVCWVWCLCQQPFHLQ
jgi:hypothetical protein